MTISNDTTKNVHSGNNVAVEYPYTFEITSSSEIEVYVDFQDGNGLTLRTLTTHYTLSGIGSSGGGAVTFVTAPVTGTRNILLKRVTPITQEADYIEGDEFPAEVHEEALDKLTRICQEQQEELDRAIKVGETSIIDPDELVADLLQAEINAEASAAAAAVSETNAAASEAAAAASALAADASADAALVSQTAAATSETNAANSATAANTSATNAATSATNAGNSATAAATSATNASNSATAAATSATNAGTSETNAAASATAAAAALDSFDDRYLGAKAANPTLDNDGNALIDGALYWNTASNEMRVYDLGTTTWSSFSGVGAVGGGPDKLFYENDQTMTTDYTITTNKNASVTGPITINNGVTLTVPNGSVLVIH